ncbi:hypothetical protein QOZ94_004295, partial [Xanthobacter agilis]|nr:hypothetical protein [Xanthobacter agilis]
MSQTHGPLVLFCGGLVFEDVESDVEDHVFLSSDHASASEFDQDLA